MTTWNYRIVKYRDENGYGLHEVHYDDNGRPRSRTTDAAGFVGENEREVIDGLELALRDARRMPVFNDPEEWPGEPPPHGL